MYIGLNAPKFETTTYRLTDLLTRVKSRDASASKNDSGATALADRLDENRLRGGGGEGDQPPRQIHYCWRESRHGHCAACGGRGIKAFKILLPVLKLL